MTTSVPYKSKILPFLLPLLTLLPQISASAQMCKYGKFVGGFNDEDCVCLASPGIYSITTSSNNCLETDIRVVAMTTSTYCYETSNREKHFFLGEVTGKPVAIGYGMDGRKVVEPENIVGLAFSGESAWKIKTSINGKDKEICVAVGAKSSICQWNLNSDAVFKFVSIDDCVSNESLLCSKIFDEEKFCTKKKIEEENDQEEIILTRYKRDANDTAAGGGGNGTGPAIDPALDEDTPLATQEEIGHELMRTQIGRYILATTANLVGITTDPRSIENLQRRYPILRLLELAKVVMQKTCPAITPTFFTMATTAFINLQLETFHLRETYISYPAFLRIQSALKRCVQDAKPHVFYKERNVTTIGGGGGGETNGTNSTGTTPSVPVEYCEGADDLMYTSNQTLRLLDPTDPAPSIVNVTVPEYATGIRAGNGSGVVINEPLTETVWKMMVNAHSYCYTRFSDYYNDHHTFTVTMLPLFSNDIQDIWLGKDGAGYDLSSGLLYGGLLGDVAKVLTDINNCVGASRHDGVAYPWFLNMPVKDMTNTWLAGPSGRRKRSSAASGWSRGGEYCLETVNDVESVGCGF